LLGYINKKGGLVSIDSHSNKRFAETLFDLHPDFIPTQALYLDLEGRQHGSEDILSIYWPMLSRTKRFSWIKRTGSSSIGAVESGAHLQSLGASNARWVVVYSAGKDSPDERSRLVDLLGRDPFPDSTWINLLHVVQKCREIKHSITKHRNVWYGADRKQVRKSLEALEWEFGIHRPVNIRSHSNRYRDRDGESGQMEVLTISRRCIDGKASEDEQMALLDYCTADVKNMYEVSRACERLQFSKTRMQERRMVVAR
jgi:hypothetical protein